MLGQSRTVPSIARVRLIAAVAASCFAIAADDPWKGEKLPEGITKVSRDDLLSRIPNFFYFNYEFGPEAGKRLWLRVDDKHWVERYPSGMETRFRVLGRARVGDISGTIVVRRTGEPEVDDNMQVFIADKADGPMQLLFRTPGHQPGDWAVLGDMKKVE
jgi:hypothetical protein